MKVRRLGRFPYPDAWALQAKLVNDRADGKISDTLLIVEHNPVYTMGRKSPEFREERVPENIHDVPVYLVERGGETTYHGPGQLVIYPIFELSPDFGPKAFLRLLEESIIHTFAGLGLAYTYWMEGQTGVWLDTPSGQRKIASLGIAVKRNVSYHGLALNLTTDLNYFQEIRPCGFSPEVMTSVARETGKKFSIEFVADRLCVEIENRFRGRTREVLHAI